MRILQVCDTYPPDSGGLGAHVRRLTQHLISRGHEVTVVAPGTDDAVGQENGFQVHRVGLSLDRIPGAYEPNSPPFHPPWPDPSFVRGLRAVVGDLAPDVVHAHGWCVHSAVSPRSPSSRHVVTTLHDYGLNCPKKSLLRFDRQCGSGRGSACLRCDDQSMAKRAGLAAALIAATPLLRRRVRCFLAVSGHVAGKAEDVGVPADRLEVVPNFIDLIDGDPIAPDQSAGRYIMYAGPASPHKGRQVLLDAYGRLQSDLDLRLVGGDGSVTAPGVEDIGFRTGPELEGLFREAAMVVVPSIWADPCPTVALEAMASGRPVVASATGGLTEIVDDGVTGLLVRPGDAGQLREAIDRLAADPSVREEMGARGRERARKFSTSTVLPILEAIYERAKESD